MRRAVKPISPYYPTRRTVTGRETGSVPGPRLGDTRSVGLLDAQSEYICQDAPSHAIG